MSITEEKIKKKKKKCYCCALCGDTPKYPAIGCPVHDKSLVESI